MRGTNIYASLGGSHSPLNSPRKHENNQQNNKRFLVHTIDLIKHTGMSDKEILDIVHTHLGVEPAEEKEEHDVR